jgi:protein-L-isoaspartate(D-aspartate) O-methyltransferase
VEVRPLPGRPPADAAPLSDDPRWEEERRDMVERQLRRRRIRDPRLLDAFLAVPRHRFVPASHRDEAYQDHPVPIARGQTISQPYMVAWMTQELGLGGGERVLEVGTGSGYQAAILAHLARELYTVERVAELSGQAERLLAELGYRNVGFRVGDGTLGWREQAPYDAVLVTAAAPRVPAALTEQLAEGGRLVMPVGGRSGQQLTLLEKRGGKTRRRRLGGCMFLPLIGEQGWPER